jgi:hypothetical protein
MKELFDVVEVRDDEEVCRSFCTSKIYGGQYRVFLFRGGLVNYEEL